MKKLSILLFCLLLYVCLAHAEAAPTLPSDPFERLLHRLDHAPIDLKATAQSSERGTRMQQVAASFARTTAPVTPMLDRVAKSRALSLMSRVPLAGRPIQLAQSAANAIANLNRGFARLVEFDKERVQPLRDASVAAACLRRNRDRDDLPAAVRSFKGAQKVLQDDEKLLQQQHQRLAQTVALLQTLAPYLEKYGRAPGKTSPSVQSVKKSLSDVEKALDTQLTQLAALRRFTGECALDGQKALDT